MYHICLDAQEKEGNKLEKSLFIRRLEDLEILQFR